MRDLEAASSAIDVPPRANIPPGAASDDIPRGILCMIAATFMFALSNTIAKMQVAAYPVGEVLFVRSTSSLFFCSLIILPTLGFGVFQTRRARAHLARGLSQTISQTFTVIALGLMPIAGVTAIGFTAPLFSAVISIVWMKERPGAWRLIVLAIGFCGAMVVIHPGSDSLQVGALFALANAVMYGSVTVAVRGMAKTESTATLLMWQVATVAVFHSFLLIFGFTRPSAADGAMLIASGAVNGFGQLMWTKALSLAPATAVSPFYYMLLAWALLIGFLVWGDIPTMSLLIGSAIVVGSGLALLWRETALKRTGSSPVPPRTWRERFRLTPQSVRNGIQSVRNPTKPRRRDQAV